MAKICFVLDLDNTLYSWMDAYAPALNAVCKFLSKQTGLTIKAIRESFKKVFQQHQSVEVINAVQELDFWDWKGIAFHEKTMIQTTAQNLFYETFKAHLRLYPNVKDVLERITNQNDLLIAYSDARAYWVDFRLKSLDIEKYFDRIYALEDVERKYIKKAYSPILIQYPQEQCKPNTAVLDAIISSYHLDVEHIYAIGDNKRKDILPATKMGICGIWAKYGMNCQSSNRRILSSVTPWSTSQRAAGGNIKPQFVIDDFSEIIKIVEEETQTKNV